MKLCGWGPHDGGAAHAEAGVRRCELVRVVGDELGIVFLEQGKYAKRKSSKPRSAVVE